MLDLIKKFFAQRIMPTPTKEDDHGDIFRKNLMHDEAIKLKKIADKGCQCSPKGNLSFYPKMARAWLFFKYEPLSFRQYVPEDANMQNFLGKLGIEVDQETAKDPSKMVEFWGRAELLLPDGYSIFEQWAVPFYHLQK